MVTVAGSNVWEVVAVTEAVPPTAATVMLAVPVFVIPAPVAVAVMATGPPAATPVTSPELASTEAIVASADDQVGAPIPLIVWPFWSLGVADNCVVAPGATLPVAGETARLVKTCVFVETPLLPPQPATAPTSTRNRAARISCLRRDD